MNVPAHDDVCASTRPGTDGRLVSMHDVLFVLGRNDVDRLMRHDDADEIGSRRQQSLGDTLDLIV